MPAAPLSAGKNGAWLPKAVFAGLAAALLLMAGLEVRNVLRHPSVLRREPGAAAGVPLVFYQKGGAAEREAWLFYEPEASSDVPVLIQHIDCTTGDRQTGAVVWTADGLAVAAVARERLAPGAEPEVLWLFEFAERRMFVRNPEWAVTGQTVIREHPLTLQKRWRDHGGAGETAAEWYALGSRGPHLFFWQTTRWELALPEG